MSRQRQRAMILYADKLQEMLPPQDTELAERVSALLVADDVDGVVQLLEPYATAPVDVYETCFAALITFAKNFRTTPQEPHLPKALAPLFTRAYHTLHLYPPVLNTEFVLTRLKRLDELLATPNVSELERAREEIGNIRAFVRSYEDALKAYEED